MNDEVRMEETGDIEAESGGVDPDVAEDHDEFDLGDIGNGFVLCDAIVTK